MSDLETLIIIAHDRLFAELSRQKSYFRREEIQIPNSMRKTDAHNRRDELLTLEQGAFAFAGIKDQWLTWTDHQQVPNLFLAIAREYSPLDCLLIACHSHVISAGTANDSNAYCDLHSGTLISALKDADIEINTTVVKSFHYDGGVRPCPLDRSLSDLIGATIDGDDDSTLLALQSLQEAFFMGPSSCDQEVHDLRGAIGHKLKSNIETISNVDDLNQVRDKLSDIRSEGLALAETRLRITASGRLGSLTEAVADCLRRLRDRFEVFGIDELPPDAGSATPQEVLKRLTPLINEILDILDELKDLVPSPLTWSLVGHE